MYVGEGRSFYCVCFFVCVQGVGVSVGVGVYILVANLSFVTCQVDIATTSSFPINIVVIFLMPCLPRPAKVFFLSEEGKVSMVTLLMRINLACVDGCSLSSLVTHTYNLHLTRVLII